MKILAWLGAGFAVFVVAVLVIAKNHHETSEDRAREGDKYAIEKCREGHNDQLQDMSTRRYMRTMCDQLASDFIKKYGESAE